MTDCQGKISIISTNSYIYDIVKQFYYNLNIELNNELNNIDKNVILYIIECHKNDVGNYAKQLAYIPTLFILDQKPDIDCIYTQKPFKALILLSQIQDSIKNQTKNIKFLNYSLEYPLMRLINVNNNKSVFLTSIEYNIIKYLYENSPQAKNKNDLLQDILGYNQNTDTHTIENHIYRLRQKIMLITDENIIQTDANGGYILL